MISTELDGTRGYMGIEGCLRRSREKAEGLPPRGYNINPFCIDLRTLFYFLYLTDPYASYYLLVSMHLVNSGFSKARKDLKQPDQV